MATRLLVIGAHAADFVWRSGGAIALTTSQGGQCLAIALSYGARGESGELWSIEGQNLEQVIKTRDDEVRAAAEILGTRFECLELDDYPLAVDTGTQENLAEIVRGFEPSTVITHCQDDPFNPDHPAAHAAAIKAEQLATGAGRAAAFKTIPQPQVLMFEPHYPDSSGFVPDVYLDITRVQEKKAKAMAAIASQLYMPEYQDMRARQRAWQARRLSGRSDIQHAEVYQRFTPQVVESLDSL